MKSFQFSAFFLGIVTDPVVSPKASKQLKSAAESSCGQPSLMWARCKHALTAVSVFLLWTLSHDCSLLLDETCLGQVCSGTQITARKSATRESFFVTWCFQALTTN